MTDNGMTNMSAPVDGFRLAYDDHQSVAPGADVPVIVCLHGWPGDRHDYGFRPAVCSSWYQNSR